MLDISGKHQGIPGRCLVGKDLSSQPWIVNIFAQGALIYVDLDHSLLYVSQHILKVLTVKI